MVNSFPYILLTIKISCR